MLEDLWLVHNAFPHESDDLVIDCHALVLEVLQLHLGLVLELTLLVQDVHCVLVCELVVVLSEHVTLVDVYPTPELVSVRTHLGELEVLASSQKMNFVDLLVQRSQVLSVRHPSEACGQPEEGHGELPFPMEGVHERKVPRERHQEVVHDVRVLEVENTVLDVLT